MKKIGGDSPSHQPVSPKSAAQRERKYAVKRPRSWPGLPRAKSRGELAGTTDWPVAVFPHSETGPRYSATFAWKLLSLKKDGVRSPERENLELLDWQNSLLHSLISESQRVLELRYTNRDAQGRACLEILLVGHLLASSKKLAWQEGGEFWCDSVSLLALAKEYYQFDPVDPAAIGNEIFSPKWPHGVEIARPCEMLKVESAKGKELGFQRPKAESHALLHFPLAQAIASSTQENTTFSQMLMLHASLLGRWTHFLYHHPFPLSVRLVLTPGILEAQEQATVQELLAALERGEKMGMEHKTLTPLDRKYACYRERIAQFAEKSLLLARVFCFSCRPVSPTTTSTLAENLYGPSPFPLVPHPLSPEETKQWQTAVFPFPGEHRQPWLMPVEEAAQLIRLPLPEDRCEGLCHTPPSVLPLPQNLPSQGILLGKKKGPGQTRPVKLSDRSKSQHVYILGQSGTGKSTLMISMALSQIKAGEGVGLIDPHGDFYEQILAKIPKSRAQDVVLFDPSDTGHVVGFNPLDYNRQRPEAKSLLIDSLMEVFSKLNHWEHIDGHAIVEMYVRNSLLVALSDQSQEHTLLDIPRILTNKEYRDQCLAHCHDPLLSDFWLNEAEKVRSDRGPSINTIAPWVTCNLNGFLFNDFVRPIMAKPSFFDFREIMDQGKILLINLSKGLLGSRNSDLLGMLLINRIFLSALSRQELPPQERRNFSLYIDEFQNFTTDNIAHIFAEARKYHLSLICANQNLSQLRPQICNSALGTVGNILCFRPGVQEVELIRQWFEPELKARDLINLPNFQVAARLLLDDRPCQPFLFETASPVVLKAGNAMALKEAFYRRLQETERKFLGQEEAEVQDESVTQSDLALMFHKLLGNDP